MRQFLSITKRELISYFATPVAYVFITIFLLLSGLFTFYLGNFFEIGQASLGSFFEWHPWLYLFLVPAITMRLWSEEKKSGTIELLTTLPVSTLNIVLGKFMAAWLFTLLALILTFPMWITVNYLGNPDNGVIVNTNKNSEFRELMQAGDKDFQLKLLELQELKRWKEGVTKALWILFAGLAAVVIRLLTEII